MTRTYLVGSRLLAIPPREVPGTGDYEKQAEQSALHASRVIGILAPVIINEKTDPAVVRQIAIGTREWVAAEFRQRYCSTQRDHKDDWWRREVPSKYKH